MFAVNGITGHWNLIGGFFPESYCMGGIFWAHKDIALIQRPYLGFSMLVDGKAKRSKGV